MATIERREVPMVEVAGVLPIGAGETIDLSQCINKGWDYILDGPVGFAARLEGSVAGQNWTLIIDLSAADSMGAIPVHYNYVRARCTAAGAKGATTRLNVAGLNQ